MPPTDPVGLGKQLQVSQAKGSKVFLLHVNLQWPQWIKLALCPYLRRCRTKETNIRSPGSGGNTRYGDRMGHCRPPFPGPGPPPPPSLHPIPPPPLLPPTLKRLTASWLTWMLQQDVIQRWSPASTGAGLITISAGVPYSTSPDTSADSKER